MNVNLNYLFIIYHNNTIAYSFKISAKFAWLFCALAITFYYKLCTVGKGYFGFKFACSVTCGFIVFIFYDFYATVIRCNYNTVTEYRHHTLKYDYKTLTAGIYNSRFFKHWQKFRCLGQSLFCTRYSVSKNTQRVFTRLERRCSAFACYTSNSKNCTFGWFHNCFIRSLYAQFKRSRQILGRYVFIATNTFSKTAEQKRCNNARVTTRATQESRCIYLRHFSCCFTANLFKFAHRVRQCHRHISTGVTVRYREYVKVIYRFSVVRKIVSGRNNRVA